MYKLNKIVAFLWANKREIVLININVISFLKNKSRIMTIIYIWILRLFLLI